MASAAQTQFVSSKPDLDDLTKRRFFYRPAFDIYGGTAGLYTYGPPGCALKNNLVNQWRKHFVIEDSMMEIEDPAVTPYRVLEASGHVERFSDFMCKDVTDPTKFYRADKLLEDCIEKLLEAGGLSEAETEHHKSVFNQADAYNQEELGAKIKEYGIKTPEGNDLTEPYPFNLMFPTQIGPSGAAPGFLRPETAQGIFVNFKYCQEQSSSMPFGVTQVGKSYRNEIAPRAGLIRLREFTQAEIEFFVNPEKKTFPKFFTHCAHLNLPLFSSDNQLAGKEPVMVNLGEAVKSGMVANETLGYFIGRTFTFLISVGMKAEHLRFRQHMPTEMAHYADDCWDAEVEGASGWTETVGIADRSCFDLTQHAKFSGQDLQISEKLEVPIEVETFELDKKAAAGLGKFFRADAKAVKEYLMNIEQSEAKKLMDAKGGVVTIGGKEFKLEESHVKFVVKKVKKHDRKYTPGVVEPSFGVDRMLSGIFEHAYYARAADDQADGKMTRGVLGFTTAVAPYKVCILPLDKRINDSEGYAKVTAAFRGELASRAISYVEDTTGAAIGRRYARNDEIGIPFACTFDFQSVMEDDAEFDGKCTVRERDSMDQVRVPVEDLGMLMEQLVVRGKDWATATAAYEKQGEASAEVSAEDYIAKHSLVEKMEIAMNEAIAAKASNPMAFIANKLQAL